MPTAITPCLEAGEVNALDAGWAILKMPLYHGTTADAWEQIQREGLKTTDHAPQFFEHDEEDIREQYGDDFERLFGGDWAFAYGDQAKLQPFFLGGRAGAIINANEWASQDDESNTVVLEIDDSHPFIEEPPIIDEDGDVTVFNQNKDQRRTNQIIPPHLIRRLSSEEVADAHRRQSQYSRMQRNNETWLDEMVREATRRNGLSMTDDEFSHLLDMRLRHSLWNQRQMGDFR